MFSFYIIPLMKTSVLIAAVATIVPLVSFAYSPTREDKTVVSQATDALQIALFQNNDSLVDTLANKLTPWSVPNGRTPGKSQYIAQSLIRNISCLKEVKKYRNQSTVAGSGVASYGDTVVIDYITALKNGIVVDTDLANIATACGLYDATRDYGNGIQFTVGSGQMVVGVESGVVGMTVGTHKTFTVAPAQAYGEWRIARVEDHQVSELPAKAAGETYQRGELVKRNGATYTVSAVSGSTVSIDTNFWLAGKDLVFDLRLKNIVH